jgi:hypothetical protein
VNAFTRFQRAVELRIIAEREERMATMAPQRVETAALSPGEMAARAAARRKALQDELTAQVRAMRVVRPDLSAREARVEVHHMRREAAREEQRAAEEERMRMAAEVVRLVMAGRTMREVADTLGLDDEKQAYAEWRWATRRRAKL